MLPVVRPLTFSAHFQKVFHDMYRNEESATPGGLLVTLMSDNAELAAEILQTTSRFQEEGDRAVALITACTLYQALKAQAESDRMESQE